MRPVQSNSDAGGFQTLFAAAAESAPVGDLGSETGAGCLSPRSLKAQAGEKKTAADTDATENGSSILDALGAALAQPLCATIPGQSSAPSGDDPRQVAAAGAVDDNVADSVSVPDLRAGTTDQPFDVARFAAGIGEASGERPDERGLGLAAADSRGVPTSAASVEIGNLDSASLPSPTERATDEPAAPIALPDDKTLPSVTTSVRKQPSANSGAALHAGPKTSGKEPVAGGGEADPADTSLGTGTASPATGPPAGVDLSVPMSAPAGQPLVSSPSRDPSAGLSGKDHAAPTTEELGVNAPPLAASAPASASATTENFAKSSRKGSSWQPEESAEDTQDAFPVAEQATSAAQATASVLSHTAAAAPQAAQSAPSALLHTHPGVSEAAPPGNVPAPPPPALHPLQVLQRMDKAEIRIGLQSENFGAIRLHTSVANDQVGAWVTTSHAGLRDALVIEAPALEKAMARHSLRLESVSVDAGSANSSFNSFENNERQQPRAGPSSAAAWQASRPPQSPSAAAPRPGTVEGNYRLDVHA
jgi:Flagellar hook-length control protein FliK